VASTEVETVEMPAVDIARPVISPDDAQRMVKDLRELIAKILVPNQHYQKIRGKDVLLKAGAEELGKFFGLSSSYSELETHWDTVEDVQVWFASVKCSVSNSHRVLAESYGFYGGDERRDYKTKKILAQPANTIVKMAQKRAYVGAILTATGTSELFTQDVEDAEAAPVAVNDRMASNGEIECLLALFIRKGGKTASEAAAWIESYGVKAESRNWVAIQVLALSQKPDKDPTVPSAEDDASAVVQSEPELPVGEAVPASGSGDTHPSGEGAAESPEIIEGEITDAIEVPW